jgi:hypothetical protein
MGNILSRIQELASNEGITIGALERKIGASKGVLSRAINNGTDIQLKWVQVIVENYPQYSTEWLITGKGEMISTRQNNSGSFLDDFPASSDIGIVVDRLLSFAKEKDEVIMEQAEEIGQLKERVAQLEREKAASSSSAHDADYEPSAHAG